MSFLHKSLPTNHLNYFLFSSAKLPKWFGERPGKKAGEPETPEGEEDAKAADVDEEEIEEVVSVSY